MGEWPQVKIKEIATHRKGSIIIQDDLQYKLCRVQLHSKGVVLRELRLGSEIKTKKQQLCKNGDLVVAEMDAKYGGYGFIGEELDGAIVSSHYYLYELDTRKIDRDYFQVLIHAGIIQNQIEAKGSTNYSSIRAWEFLDYSIPLPDLKFQKKIAMRFFSFYNFRTGLHLDSDSQFFLIKLLRQAIRQEAIEGKLTADWRKKHPELISGENHASKLLEKIKAEKERIFKEGKIKKDKPLFSVPDAEKPFDIPKDWVFCGVVELIDYANNLDIHKKLSANTLINYVDIDSIDNKRHKIKEIKIKKMSELSSRARRVLKKGYVVYSTVRPYLENIAFVEKDMEYLIGSTGFIVFKTLIIDGRYIFNLLLSPYINKLYQKMMIGFNSPSITNEQFENTVVPLPPLAEQQAIVERVEKMMAMIEELEKQVTERKDKSERLMQAVLREAFTN